MKFNDTQTKWITFDANTLYMNIFIQNSFERYLSEFVSRKQIMYNNMTLKEEDFSFVQITNNEMQIQEYSDHSSLASNKEQIVKDAENNDELIFCFEIAKRDVNTSYYKLKNHVFKSAAEETETIYFHKSIISELKSKHFVSTERPSFMYYILHALDNNLFVEGDNARMVKLSAYEKLVSTFPSNSEVRYYKTSQVSKILDAYFNEFTDKYSEITENFDAYLERKNDAPILEIHKKNFNVAEYETKKYNFLYEKLQNILAELLDAEIDPLERDWQRGILEILEIIYPQYLHILSNIKFTSNGQKKEIDYLVINENGFIDVIELKRGSTQILRNTKYRNNHIPSRELSGTIMQCETYIYLLNSMNEQNRKKFKMEIARKLRSQGIEFDSEKISIGNPRGIIICGRSKDFDSKKTIDYEIIKRKYKHIADIFSYDELLERIKNIKDKYQIKQENM